MVKHFSYFSSFLSYIIFLKTLALVTQEFKVGKRLITTIDSLMSDFESILVNTSVQYYCSSIGRKC